MKTNRNQTKNKHFQTMKRKLTITTIKLKPKRKK